MGRQSYYKLIWRSLIPFTEARCSKSWSHIMYKSTISLQYQNFVETHKQDYHLMDETDFLQDRSRFCRWHHLDLRKDTASTWSNGQTRTRSCKGVSLLQLGWNSVPDLNPFKRQPHKMVKHTQTIRQQIADKLFECVNHFVGLALKGLNQDPAQPN